MIQTTRQFRQQIHQQLQQQHRHHVGVVLGVNIWPNPRYQLEWRIEHHELEPEHVPTLFTNKENKIESLFSCKLFPQHCGFWVRVVEIYVLPDDRKMILPFARRTNGRNICVKRAAPVQWNILRLLWICLLRAHKPRIFLSIRPYPINLCQWIFAKQQTESIQALQVPPKLHN